MRLRLGLALVLVLFSVAAPLSVPRAGARPDESSYRPFVLPAVPQAADEDEGIALGPDAAVSLALGGSPRVAIARLGVEGAQAALDTLRETVKQPAALAAYLKKKYAIARAEGSEAEGQLVLEQGELALTQARAALATVQRGVRLQVLSAYAGLVKQDAMLAAAADALQRAQAQAAQVQAAIDAGAATAADGQAARAQVAGLGSRLQALQAQRAAAAATLAGALGISQGAALRATAELPDGSGPAPDLQDSLLRAMTQRLDLEQARWALEVASVDRRIAAAYPDADQAAWQRALEQASLQVSQVRQDVELQVRQAYYGWQAARARLDGMQPALDAATAAAAAVQARYDAGAATSSELVAAEAAVSQARADLIQARADLWVAAAQLASARGE